MGKRLLKNIERFAREKGVSESEYARDAIRRYVGVIRFRELQQRTIRYLKARGMRVDDVAL